MAKRKPLVIVTRRLPDVVETRMRELFDAQLNLEDRAMTQAELIEAVGKAEILVPTVTDRIDKAVLAQAGPQLKLIANFGTGVDNIDVETATNRGIIVTNTPGVLTEDTADMTMALVLAVARRLTEGAAIISDGKDWGGWSPTWMLGHRIYGKRLGIIGMGRIGQAVARRAKAFGLQIHYHNRRPVNPRIEDELEATYWESLDQMLARMDIISVNCPHTPATYHLLNARRLKLMKPEAIIVNTSRGEVIDENALARMLEANELGGAGLDVFEHEPAVNPRLVKCERAVLLPHMGSATLEGRIEFARIDDEDAELPEALRDRIAKAVRWADESTPDPYERQPIINAAANVLGSAGMDDVAKQLLLKEIGISRQPYYFMPDIADIEQRAGNFEAAIDWLKKGYDTSSGPATRFQWGYMYLVGLLEMAPEDVATIESVTVSLISEVQAGGGLYNRPKAQLERLEGKLRTWSEEYGGAPALASIRNAVAAVCGKDPEAASRAACESFLDAA